MQTSLIIWFYLFDLENQSTVFVSVTHRTFLHLVLPPFRKSWLHGPVWCRGRFVELQSINLTMEEHLLTFQAKCGPEKSDQDNDSILLTEPHIILSVFFLSCTWLFFSEREDCFTFQEQHLPCSCDKIIFVCKGCCLLFISWFYNPMPVSNIYNLNKMFLALPEILQNYCLRGKKVVIFKCLCLCCFEIKFWMWCQTKPTSRSPFALAFFIFDCLPLIYKWADFEGISQSVGGRRGEKKRLFPWLTTLKLEKLFFRSCFSSESKHTLF